MAHTRTAAVAVALVVLEWLAALLAHHQNQVGKAAQVYILAIGHRLPLPVILASMLAVVAVATAMVEALGPAVSVAVEMVGQVRLELLALTVSVAVAVEPRARSMVATVAMELL